MTRQEATRGALAMHKFAVGDLVHYKPMLRAMASPGLYGIVLLLPDDGSAPQYRIRSTTEAFERVVREFELAPPRASRQTE